MKLEPNLAAIIREKTDHEHHHDGSRHPGHEQE